MVHYFRHFRLPAAPGRLSRGAVVKRSLLVVASLISRSRCRAPAQQAGSCLRKITSKVVPYTPIPPRRWNLQGAVKLQVTVLANGNVKRRGRQPGARTGGVNTGGAPKFEAGTEGVELRFDKK